MSSDTETLREDLAFMRALVTAGDSYSRPFAEGYFAAGVIYGVQFLLHGVQFFGAIPSTPALSLSIGLGPTVVFVVAMAWNSWRRRHDRPPTSTGRAVAVMFGCIGLANLALIGVIGSVAWREQSLTTWLVYPCTVFVLQGAAWLFAWQLRRRAWLGFVGLGWFVCGVAMALSVQSLGYFLLAGGIGMWVCMALPGWVMTRLARAVAG